MTDPFFVLDASGGDRDETVTKVVAYLATLPREGQTAAQEAAERERLEALKARLEALP